MSTPTSSSHTLSSPDRATALSPLCDCGIIAGRRGALSGGCQPPGQCRQGCAASRRHWMRRTESIGSSSDSTASIWRAFGAHLSCGTRGSAPYLTDEQAESRLGSRRSVDRQCGRPRRQLVDRLRDGLSGSGPGRWRAKRTSPLFEGGAGLSPRVGTRSARPETFAPRARVASGGLAPAASAPTHHTAIA